MLQYWKEDVFFTTTFKSILEDVILAKYII